MGRMRLTYQDTLGGTVFWLRGTRTKSARSDSRSLPQSTCHSQAQVFGHRWGYMVKAHLITPEAQVQGVRRCTMAMTVQQIHPVAHLPLVLGVLRRLEVAPLLDGLIPPPPCPWALVWTWGRSLGAGHSGW